MKEAAGASENSAAMAKEIGSENTVIESHVRGAVKTPLFRRPKIHAPSAASTANIAKSIFARLKLAVGEGITNNGSKKVKKSIKKNGAFSSIDGGAISDAAALVSVESGS
jgi:hypothetical protein